MNFYDDKKVHYKMYKVGKKWVISGIITTSFFIGLGLTNVNADSNGQNLISNSSLRSSANNSSILSNSTSSNTSSSSANNSSTVNNGSSSNTSSSSVDNNSSAVNNGSSSNTSSSSVDNNSSAVNNGSSSNTSSSSADNNSSAVNSNSSNASSINNDYTNSLFIAFNDNSSFSNLNQSLSSDASDKFSLKVKEDNGNYYYYNDSDNISKSLLVHDNDKLYYFDNNGMLNSLNNSLPNDFGQIKSYLNNSIYDNDIDNVNGFIMANAWYRPKNILQNGVNWVPSSSDEYRPLLTVWWPNKNIEVNYLNYMNAQGLIDNNFSYDASQDDLNSAASIVQANIEKKISSNNNDVNWLKQDINNFISSQDIWNINSEDYDINDGFQGGSLLYENSNLTPNANSNYRLLNRTPTKQNGTVQYNKDSYAGYEFLLANDVDNSNPVVQAEDLNWLYYLLNFGSIVKNDPSANFDSIRVDAVENMDADVLDIASKYFKDAYNTNLSDKNANDHLSILEDWSKNDAYYLKDRGSNQLTIDGTFLDAVQADLLKSPDQRYGLESLVNTGLVNRDNNNTENQAIPNYSMVRAHDNGVQDVIAKIITDNINPKSNGFILTNDELNQAFKIYDADQKLTNKKYTQYNIPSAYALLLTNKDTIPRVYYGDLFTDDGQFMATKTPYYESISSMLQARTKYVSGGQSTNVSYVNGDPSMNNSYKGILTSVRYGKGALSQTDLGDNTTRSSGIAVVESNNPNLKLSDTDKVVINMGAAHKNQAYRPLIDSGNDSLLTYDKDSDTSKVIYTNSQGQLILDKSNINGYSNPQESGYLSMWVPVGAPDDQDIRTTPSDKTSTDNNTIHSNSALDSNVIFEAFSNFQAQPTTNDEYENVILPQKTDLFNKWGVTYMQLPPQYRSTDDNSFLDSTVHNGYAFNDRYDLGFNTPTKYGNVDQLINTIKSLHSNNIKVMADFVPDQLYSLPNQQLVTVTRVDQYGKKLPGTDIDNKLYYSSTVGSGNDYQSKYGGEFLQELQQKYPDLFTVKQVSTNEPIDSSEKIKTWEAKYFNGTNIQGRGADFVLSNSDNSDYFHVSSNDDKSNFIPKQLKGESFDYGFAKDGNNVKYISTNGYEVKNTFIKSNNGNWYYFDNNGNMVNQPTEINGNDYYFLNNGINLRNFTEKMNDGSLYFYQENGSKVTLPGYYSAPNSNIVHVGTNGSLTTGLYNIENSSIKQYFNDDGTQVKNKIVNIGSQLIYFDSNLGNSYSDSFFNYNGNWYYANKDGYLLTGIQNIGGQTVYFDNNGIQVKGQIENVNGNLMYFDSNSGELIVNKQLNVNGVVYNADNNGILSKQYDHNSSSATINSTSSSSSNSSTSASNTASSSNSSTSASNTASLSNSSASASNTASSSNSSTSASNTVSSSNSSTSASNTASSSNSSTSASNTASSSNSSTSASNTASSSNISKSDSDHDKINKAKAKMNKAIYEVKVAKKHVKSKNDKKNVNKYNRAIKHYYQTEKQYLNTAKLYNKRYYYDFDQVTRRSKYVKISKTSYVHNSKKFTKHSRVKKISKNTKVKVNKIVRHGKTTRFNIGHNKFITGLKSFIQKIK